MTAAAKASESRFTYCVHPTDCLVVQCLAVLNGGGNVFFVDFLKPEVTGNYILATPTAELFIKQNRIHFKQKYR